MNNKGSMVLLTIIATLTLLVAVVGTTFSYFSATFKNRDEKKTIEVTSGTLLVEYDTNSKLESTTAMPEQVVAKKTFNVEGIITGSNNLKYDVDLKVSENAYEDGELVYSLVSKNVSNNGYTITNTTEEVALPKGKSDVKIGTGSFAGPISSGSTHTYTLVIKYISKSHEESNKAFKAKLSIKQAS